MLYPGHGRDADGGELSQHPPVPVRPQWVKRDMMSPLRMAMPRSGRAATGDAMLSPKITRRLLDTFTHRENPHERAATEKVGRLTGNLTSPEGNDTTEPGTATQPPASAPEAGLTTQTPEPASR